jgi:2',3'-cyclic-nucleotide 2'-phosphodiesterase (5'-nucleotidase family)
MTYTLQLLHASDLEGGVAALENAPNFAAIVDSLEDTFANTLLVSAGDNFIPGPFFSTAADPTLAPVLSDAYERFVTEVQGVELGEVNVDLGAGVGRVDMMIMNVLGFDASTFGNHEFDAGTSALGSIINASGGGGTINWTGALFPYLSSNIDFSGDGNLGRLYVDEILDAESFAESVADLAAGNIGPAIAPATIVDVNGEAVGIVGATTQVIQSISSTGGIRETTGGATDMAALATAIQPQIDALIAAGANKIILTSHLQQIALEKELAGLLDGVDIIIAGGSSTLQADAGDRLRDGDTAREGYPFLTQDAGGNPVAVVSTDEQYSYVGRLVVEFDDNGVLIVESIDEAVSGAYATDMQGVLDVAGAQTLEEAIAGSAKAGIVQDLSTAVGAIVEAADAVIFGNHDVFLDGRRETVRTEESNLGNLTADANLEAAREADDTVLVSFKNGGGIRAEIGSATDTGTDAGDGKLSQLDIQNSLRFDNQLILVSLAPEGLLMLLEHGVAETDTAAGATPGRFFQIGGLRVSFDETAPAQRLVTDENGRYVVDPETGMPAVDVVGERIQTIALIDPETGADNVIYRDGAFTDAAPESIRMVTLDFLVEQNGDGYPFQELATDIAYVTQDRGITLDPNDPAILGEQQALADFMTANFSDGDSFAMAETDVTNDLRIVQLARNGGIDRILLDETGDRLDIKVGAEFLSGETELFTGGSEVVSVDGDRAFVSNGAQGRIDVFDTASGEKVNSIDLAAIDFGITAPATPAMLEGRNGYETRAIFSVGDTITDTSGALNLSTAGDYTPVGILDGIGAMELNETTVRVFVNHELNNGDGYAYRLENGLELTGARISYFDIDKDSKAIIDSGLAYDTIHAPDGAVISDIAQLVEGRSGFDRFCSSVLVESHQFGEGRGLEDTIYFAGEETGGGSSLVSGNEWALDAQTGELWAVPAMGRGAWENVTEIDTGTATHVAFILADDTAPYDADGDGENEAAPLYLYVGEKNPDGDFLARNGLENGKLYVWAADGGAADPRDFNTEGTVGGTWVEIDNSQKLDLASEDGSTGYDAYGYPTQANLWTQAEALGAFGFSRPEDVATNPADGSEVVLASTGRDGEFDGADQVGTIYSIKTDFSDIDNPTSSATILYDGDADPDQTLRSPDNLDWADDGLIYIQEDRAADGLFGEGAANRADAGIVRLNPATGEVIRVAEMQQDVTLGGVDENVAASGRQDVGNWESSGILDVSTLFGEAPGTLFLYDVQAHSLDDQDRFGNSALPRLTDGDLKEGGQLGFLAAPGSTALAGVNETPVTFAGVQSVAAMNGLVAAAISVTPAHANGVVAIFDAEGTLLHSVEVGNLPDMLTFTPDGSKILVANEGEPTDVNDPLGSVSIIDLSDLGGEPVAASTTFTLQGILADHGPNDNIDGEDGFDPQTIAPVTVELEFASGTDSVGYTVVGPDPEGPSFPALIDFTDAGPISIRVNGEVWDDNSNDDYPDVLTGFETAEGTRHALMVLGGADNKEIIFFVGGETPPPFETAEDLTAIVNAGSFFVIQPDDPLLGAFAPDQDIPFTSFDGVEVTENEASAGEPTVTTLDFSAFDGQEDALREAGVLIQPGKSASEDLEPEYITVLPDGETAWVSLQEANAYAVVDLASNTVTGLRSFGLVDRSLPGNEIDASNRDNAINLQNYDNLFGMRQPDAIKAVEIDGETYILTANEGDARDATQSRVRDLDLDATAFPNAEILQLDENLGRLNVRSDIGDTDGDGDFDQLFHYGARSFTIYNEAGEIVYDSGALFSQLIAEIRPDLFNHDEGDFDDRSDDKGVEPEAIAVGEVGGRTYAFIGLERDNGILIFDVSNPTAPVFEQYIDAEANGNISPEIIQFIPASESAAGKAQLAVAFEGDGNTVLYDLDFRPDLVGAPLDDTLTGSDSGDLIVGRAGNDQIDGGAGDDTVNGGIGDDTIDGAAGNDDLLGFVGNDVIGGGIGSDTIRGNAGDDTLFGSDGDDVMNGGIGNDLVSGDAGNDRIILRSGDDIGDGGIGNDTISGNAGNDTLFGGDGDDVMNGGIGNDRVSGDAGNDRIILRSGDDIGDGGDGSDTISGNAGNDILFGGDGDDVLNGGIGNDRLDGGAGNDVIFGGLGADTFVFASGGGSDIFRGFTGGADLAASDRLELDQGLWFETSGPLSALEVVETFAAINDRGFVEFVFTETDSFELAGVRATSNLENYIDIV